MKIFGLLETQYNQFTQKVKSYLSKSLSQSDTSFGSSTIFGQLINVLGNVVQNIMLYIEDSLVEQNKYTAQRKKSIYGLAALSGYDPSYGKAAGVQLKLNFVPNNEQHLNVIINNKQQLTCTQNGLQYNLILPQEAIIMSLDKDSSSKYVYAVQGRFEKQNFTAIGGKYYTQNFKFLGNMDSKYITVKINGETWEYEPSLYDMLPDGKQYTYKTSNISGVDLIFGNDVHGRSLKNGDSIEVEYLVHDGEYGNLDPNIETYFIFNSNLSDVSGKSIDGNSIFNLTFSIKDPVTSGTNSEPIEPVKQMIGLNSRSLVLASSENYSNFISKFSFCGYNRTWSDPGSMIINSIIMKNYKHQLENGLDYFKLNESDFFLTDTQKQSIINCLELSGNQLAGVKYNILDPDLYKYAMYVYIKLKGSDGDKDYITTSIKKLIGEFFSNINNDIFVPKSDIIHLLKSEISQIDGINIYFLSEKNELAIITNTYEIDEITYNKLTGAYEKIHRNVYVEPGTNPNLGLDGHGNIYLKNNNQFPVLMGGWDYKNKNGDLVRINDPLIIIFE